MIPPSMMPAIPWANPSLSGGGGGIEARSSTVRLVSPAARMTIPIRIVMVTLVNDDIDSTALLPGEVSGAGIETGRPLVYDT